MEDIFLDDPRQVSAQKIARNQKEKKAPKRRLREYMFDFIIKSLLLATLLAFDFTLFAEAGGYNLFTSSQMLTPEAGWIYTAIVIFSFAAIFLCSFSLTLQNLMVGLGAAFLLLAIFNQFALFDPNSFLAAYFNTSRIGNTADVFGNYSHLVAASGLLVAIFLFLTYARRTNQAYLLGTLLLIFGALLSEAYFNPVTRAFDTKTALNDQSSHPDSRNFVFIALPEAPSFHKLQSFDAEGKNTDIKQAEDNVLGFYLQNNFTYYPYAYTRHIDLPFLNLADTLNAGSNKTPEELLLSNVVLNGYWDFKKLGHEKIYLRQNRVFDTFHKNDYNLRVYQGEGIELCTVDSQVVVNRCVERVTLPISFADLDIGFAQKVVLLSAQWLESTGFIPSNNPLFGAVSLLNSNVAPLSFDTTQLTAFNAFKNLDRIAEDIATDQGNNAYFTVVDLPADLFIYDNLCNLKPISRWVSAQDQNTGLTNRKAAFAEQTSCLYGQMENFIQKLQKSGKLAHTVVVIQGLSTPFAAAPGPEKDMFQTLQATKQTGMAIYDPLKNEANIDYQLCTAPSLLRNYLYKKPCTELEDMAITDQLKADIMQQAQKQKLTNKQAESARTSFKNWYQSWAAHNQVENAMDKENIPLEVITPDTPEIVPEKEIQTVNVAKTEELAPEKVEKPLSAAVSEAKEEAKPQPEPKTEETKTQPQPKKKEVKVEVKVIDQSTANDVVPPFLLGKLEYKPAEAATE